MRIRKKTCPLLLQTFLIEHKSYLVTDKGEMTCLGGPQQYTTPMRETSHTTSDMDDSYYQNLYKTDPDFRQLARQDSDFAAL